MPEKKRTAPKPRTPTPDIQDTDKKSSAEKKAPRAASKAAAPGSPSKPAKAGSPAKTSSRKAPAARAAAPGPRKQKPAAALSLNVLMISPEAHPYAHTGGLAEVAAALPQALGGIGHRVTLVIPRYRGVDITGTRAQPASVTLGSRQVEVTFHTGVSRGGVTPVFVDVPELFDRSGLYGDDGRDYPDNAWRFAVFSRSALEYARLRGERPSVIHAHDWQTGMVPVFQKMQFSDDPVIGRVPVIFTIHNLAFQGVFPPTTLPEVGLGWEVMDVQALEYWGQISYLKGGINFSERITTVSPSYAREILTPALGFGLEGALQRRADELSGILNAIDVTRWDPEHDELVGASFSADNLSGKAKAKQILLETVGLPSDAAGLARPVIGLISRLTHQKGLDLIADAMDELMTIDASWVMLGSGNREYEELWGALAAKYPDRVSTTIGFEERLAHRIEAGADMFLMPSRYEPCGLNQLYSLRYGTLPIVHATGGLDDTVRAAPERAPNGFKFTELTPTALVGAVRSAVQLFGDPGEWKKMQRAGMKDDYSWDVSAREYVKVYKGAARAAGEFLPEAP